MESFEEISFHVLSYIHTLRGVTDVVVAPRDPASQVQMDEWNRKHRPCSLPEDLAAFYNVTDGLSLTWKAQSLESNITVGVLGIRALKDLCTQEVPFPGSTESTESSISAINGSELAKEIQEHRLPSKATALILDHNPKVGEVALIYDASDESGATVNGVWFKDLKEQWHYMAENFSCYYRLMIVHLGILGWQYAYTPAGLDPRSIQWMRLYIPERLMFDNQHRNHSAVET